MTLTQLQEELEKPENRKMKMLDIIREPSYISKLKLMGKEIDKKRDINGLKLDLPDEKEKLTVFQFRRLIILTQVCVKGGQLREEITKKVNISALKAFAYK